MGKNEEPQEAGPQASPRNRNKVGKFEMKENVLIEKGKYIKISMGILCALV
jgi:hypothetical protein